MSLVRPLERVASPRVLVVGGGIAGLHAALEVAAVGLPVTLVEEGPSLGGLMAQLDKTFPTNDCAMCILSPRMLEAARHPLIDLQTLTRVVQIQGEAGDFRVCLSRRPRFVDLSRCSGCGECVRVCPRRLPDPYNLALSQTRAIHIPFPQAVPQAAYIEAGACRALQGRKCEACLQVCLAGAIDLEQAPETWVESVGAVILASGARPARPVHFPGIGHPDVVTSLEFERLLSATGPGAGRLLRPSDGAPPAKIAFVQCAGSRDLRQGATYCSTLCCLASLKEAMVAQELSAAGVDCALFYLDLRVQGKGYESYLARAREHRVRLIRSRVTAVIPRTGGGVLVRYTQSQGRPKEAHFDLAVLAVGLQTTDPWRKWAAALGVPLNEHGFIRTSPLTPAATTRPGVLVCGTAREPMDIADAVTSAGAAAAAVGQLLTVSPRVWAWKREPPLPAPAAEATPRVGVFLCDCGTNIARTIDLEKLTAAVRQFPGVVHVEEQLFSCAAEATGRLAEAIRTLGLNRVVVAACSPQTHEPLFREVVAAAGLNPGYLAFANLREQCAWVHQEDPAGAQEKAWRLVAMAVLRARVLDLLTVQKFPVLPRALVLGGGVAGLSAALTLADQGFHTYLVERSPYLGGLARQLHFTLEGLGPQEFLQDLESAVYGHLNVQVLTSAELMRVEGHVGQFQSTVRRVSPSGSQEHRLEHGVILVATGGRAFDPQGRWLYGEDPRVLTQLELEDHLQAGAPALARARRLVMVQCVGSREPEHPYCSRVCCSQALKNALLLKKRYPLLDVTILYRDLQAYGWRESYYQQAKEQRVEFLPYGEARAPELSAPRRGPLTVRVWDELLGEEVELAADLLVLSVGVEPAPGSRELARLLKIPLTLEGFFLEAHQKLRPMDAPADGIFLCGLAHYPKSLAEAASQGQAAAMRAAGLLFQTDLPGGEVMALIHRQRCRRCLGCLEVCPFGAIDLDAARRPEVQAAVCRGCGICAAECPGNAIRMSRYSDAELEAQIEGALG